MRAEANADAWQQGRDQLNRALGAWARDQRAEGATARRMAEELTWVVAQFDTLGGLQQWLGRQGESSGGAAA
eukprot:8166176-Alexandrium_andersonii.AAC.1